MSIELLHVKKIGTELSQLSNLVIPKDLCVVNRAYNKMFQFYHRIRNCVSGIVERVLDQEGKTKGLILDLLDMMFNVLYL